MAEQLDLTSPVVIPNVANYRVSVLSLLWDDAVISIALRDNNGQVLSFSYNGAQATSMMTVLNKANLTSNSLHKRVLNQLVSDGFLAGTVSGSPA